MCEYVTAKVHVLVVSRLDKDSQCQTESDKNGDRETGLERKTKDKQRESGWDSDQGWTESDQGRTGSDQGWTGSDKDGQRVKRIKGQQG